MFSSAQVWPSWGHKTCWVSWEHSFPAGTGFHLWRSPNGVAGWELVNETPVYGHDYEDTLGDVGDALATMYYRVAAFDVDGNERGESGVVMPREALTPLERAAISGIIRQEYLIASRIDGIRVVHFAGLYNAVTGDKVDAETNQVHGPECEGTNAGTSSTVGPVIDGVRLAPPRQTFVRLLGAQQARQFLDPNGLGTIDSNRLVGRFLAFPIPRPGDVIVHVPTDRRMAVLPAVVTMRFNGHYPVAHTAELRLLPKSHEAYRVPVPLPVAEGKHVLTRP